MGYVIGLGIVFMVVFGAALPVAVNGQFNAFVKENYKSVESVNISYVEAIPSSIVTGDLAEVNIKLKKATVNNIQISAVDIVAKPVKFDPMDVAFNKKFTMLAPTNAHVKIMITDADFRAMFNESAVINKLSTIETSLSIMPTEHVEKQIISILKPVVTIEKSGVRTDFILQKKNEPDTAVPITIIAHLEVHGDKKLLDLHIDSIAVDGIEMPQSLADTVATSFNPVINLSNYDTKDMKITFDKFTTYDGYFIIEGDTIISALR